MTDLSQFWRDLEEAGGPLPYLLIDCAGIEGGRERMPDEVFSEIECLFTGELADELKDVAGYLARVKSFDAEVEERVRELLQRQVAVLLQPKFSNTSDNATKEPTFAVMHRHFRKFNVVYDPAGQPLYFRYYDPRVLPGVLAVMTALQRSGFMLLVDGFVVLDTDGRMLRADGESDKI